ncbi:MULTISPECIES: DUF1365 domain-containing protein [unclassified Polaromonas]|jgi:DUF1365 family protein|uniref:DUF1365 domain-containing protein n=1 Tax=unclassified Polaromonas TaxID=2638319 RepID=UPI000BC7EFE6|nr:MULTISPECIES: DUF1365 domain-containing protein [unclassified Polaromonas]OYY38492.1 MAG: DUF1365 domain-containing protein [Polaromonas sp. 35-63-35]OYZ21350.1 MAG: DUF1365 domain-containing protein [Polaromonas sp. 16-63-31]OYZ79104.1 MAG: DUF1365 domain-containing protein [Polaromonas sp. 24-63-21]OZA50230.1 MAG: DUF1365 domain-containing protein [Polaromonas sp. 17-63-33]OZA89272.1 MAG: DUF1365 domain-containing protein [Polaromonas sp. 39-63-25]
MSASPAQALIGFGEVRHTRLKPAVNAFNYPTYFLMLPLRSLRQHGNGALARNRGAALSFFDRDHGEGGDDCLAWVDALLEREGITDAAGEVWLHTYPRVFGYTFKPVSFWYCHNAAGELRAIVVEVNNTFGERHCYLLDHPRYGQELQAVKVFHVSPFCTLDGFYRFRFMRVENEGVEKTVARIDYDDASGPLLQTSVAGTLQVLSAATLRKALWGYPAMTFGVVARIHWQALKLWRKRVPVVSKPQPPEIFVTR